MPFTIGPGNAEALVIPGPRAALNAPSPTIDRIRADRGAPFRVVGMDRSFLGDYPAVYNLEGIFSCAPLSDGGFIGLFRNFPGIKFDGTWMTQVSDPARAQPLLNLLNVKYVLARPGRVLPEGSGFRAVDQGDFEVFENLEVWPRAFFSDRVVSLSSAEEFNRYLLANGGHPFVALTPEEIESQPGLRSLVAAPGNNALPAVAFELRPNSTAFDVHAPSAGVVCLTEGSARDFMVEVNQEPRPVLTVNRAFKGVYLDRPGDYRLKFVYRPRHWRTACAAFWSAVAGAILLGILSAFRPVGKRL